MGEDRKLVRILDVDPELGHLLPEQDVPLARRYLVAEVVELEAGDWEPPPQFANREPGTLGLLVLDGLLCRSVRLGNTACAELVGQGDVLRPWQEDCGWSVAEFNGDWAVLEPTRLAVLGRRVAAAAGRWPELMETVVARTVHRARCLAFHMSLSALTRVDVRLLGLFWFLADRWGRVTPQGIVLTLPLTHQTLAQLVGAQRPSVTTALGQLTDAGRVSRCNGGWILHGQPPVELTEVRQMVGTGDSRGG